MKLISVDLQPCCSYNTFIGKDEFVNSALSKVKLSVSCAVELETDIVLHQVLHRVRNITFQTLHSKRYIDEINSN
jgi:hypothetical protein